MGPKRIKTCSDDLVASLSYTVVVFQSDFEQQPGNKYYHMNT